MLPRHSTSAVLVGDSLALCSVGASALGAATAGPVVIIPGFLTAPADEVRRLIQKAQPKGPLTLTLPSSLCSIRPAAVPLRTWRSARPELVASAHELFPIPPGRAMLGLIERMSPEGEPDGGYLIAADSAAVQPLVQAVERATGMKVATILAPQMAMLGLGLQGRASASVSERTNWGGVMEHGLSWGRVTELMRPPSGTPADAAIPEASATPSPREIHEFTIAAALAGLVARDSFAPLSGTVPASRRWLAPALAAAAAIAVLVGAQALSAWRYERGERDIQAQRQATSALLADATATRDELVTLSARLNAASKLQSAASDGASALAALAEVRSILPASAFLYRVEIDSQSITVRGEAPRAGDVLRAIEEAPSFQAAREVDTAVIVEERGLEMFNIRGERVRPATPAAPPSIPPPMPPASDPPSVAPAPSGGAS